MNKRGVDKGRVPEDFPEEHYSTYVRGSGFYMASEVWKWFKNHCSEQMQSSDDTAEVEK